MVVWLQASFLKITSSILVFLLKKYYHYKLTIIRSTKD